MPSVNKLSVVIITIIVLVLGYAFFTMPDRRSPTEKLGDAIHDLDKGPDKAARQLESRTPADRLSDVVKDTGKKMQNSTQGQ